MAEIVDFLGAGDGEAGFSDGLGGLAPGHVNFGEGVVDAHQLGRASGEILLERFTEGSGLGWALRFGVLGAEFIPHGELLGRGAAFGGIGAHGFKAGDSGVEAELLEVERGLGLVELPADLFIGGLFVADAGEVLFGVRKAAKHGEGAGLFDAEVLGGDAIASGLEGIDYLGEASGGFLIASLLAGEEGEALAGEELIVRRGAGGESFFKDGSGVVKLAEFFQQIATEAETLGDLNNVAGGAIVGEGGVDEW